MNDTQLLSSARMRRVTPLARPARLASTLAAAATLALCVLATAAAEPQAHSKYGGTLVVGLSVGDAASLDPRVTGNTASLAVLQTICQRLYDRNAKFELVPVLAASLPQLSTDKLSYTIQLRKGVLFNDGTPFNAQAVVTTVKQYMTYPGSPKASDYASVASVEATGPYTVVFRMKGRDSTFNASAPGDLMLSPTQLDKLGDSFGTNPVCVGPFMYDGRATGAHVTVIKSPYYYDRNTVYLDKIVYRPTTDAVAAAAALKAGDIDVLSQLAVTEVDAVRNTPGLRVQDALQIGWQGLFINIGNRAGLGNLPYGNVGTALASSAKLRQAFEEAIDRNTMNRVLFGGLNQVSCTPIPPANTAWYDAIKVPCTPYNPKHAKQLVAESGIANPTVRLLTFTGSARTAEVIQQMEAAVGITVIVELTDSPTAIARGVAGNFDVYYSAFGPGDPDPAIMINPFLATSGSRNFSGYSNPRLDLILSNGMKATSTKARSTLYRAALQIVGAERPMIFLSNPRSRLGSSTDVMGVGLTYNGGLDLVHARFT